MPVPTADALTVQLMPVQMLGPRIALAASFVRTLKLLVESLSASSPLPRGAVRLAAICIVAIVLAVDILALPPAASGVVAVGGRWGLGLDGTARRLHLLGELCLNLAKVGRVPCVH
jgi:hypothetical protein